MRTGNCAVQRRTVAQCWKAEKEHRLRYSPTAAGEGGSGRKPALVGCSGARGGDLSAPREPPHTAVQAAY